MNSIITKLLTVIIFLILAACGKGDIVDDKKFIEPTTHELTLSVTGEGVVLSKPNGINCGLDCRESFVEDTIVILNATAAAGSDFSNWSGDTDCDDGSVTLSTAVSCIANFVPSVDADTIYSLNINANPGTGSGTVTSNPMGIDCGSSCNQDYDEDTNIILTGIPNTNSQFAGWSGDADCTDGVITLDADMSCTATFELVPVVVSHSLTVSSNNGAGSGTVTSSPNGINCGVNCSQEYNEDSSVTLTAAPDAGSEFAGWTGDADCFDGIVTVDAEKTCTATFNLISYTLSVSTNTGAGTGTVTSKPYGINCKVDCSQKYNEGSDVTLTVIPDTGSEFAGWGGDADCNDNSITLNGNRSCHAVFNLIPAVTQNLSIVTNGTGTGVVTSNPAGIACGTDCTYDFMKNSGVTLTVTPNTNSEFTGWTGNADCSDGNVILNSSLSCTATFNLVSHTLSTSVNMGSGTGTVTSNLEGINCGIDCTQNYVKGSIVGLNATPDAGSEFAGWEGDADCNDNSITLNGNLTCHAIFNIIPAVSHNLSIATNGTGTGFVSSNPAGISCGTDCTQGYNEGTTITLLATPDADNVFAGWTGDADCSDGKVTVNANLSCTATFNLITHTLAILPIITGTGTGTVTSNPIGIDCGTDCIHDYAEGIEVILTATPDAGSEFVRWAGPTECADGRVTMTSKMVGCMAIFNLLPATEFTFAMNIIGSGTGTVTSNPTGIDCGGAGNDCNEIYNKGSNVTFTATPDAGSELADIIGDVGCSDGNVTLNTNISCRVTFNLISHTLTTSTNTGTGTGTVTSDPTGINCGTDCTQDYNQGTIVGLTVTPDASSEFAGWTGDADCNDNSITLNDNMSCHAVFTLIPVVHHLAVSVIHTNSAQGNVSSNPPGIDCGNGGTDCGGDYVEGTLVTLTATPGIGAEFITWSGDADCSDGSVTLNASLDCRATFDLISHTLSINANSGTGRGTVTSSPTGINCGLDCTQDYVEGSIVALTAIPDPDSEFIGWTGGADCDDNVVTMSADISCNAMFELVHTLNITVSKGTGAGIVTGNPIGILCGADCVENYSEGTVVNLAVTPAVGSVFSGWEGDADCDDNSVTMSSNITCDAIFSRLLDIVLVVDTSGSMIEEVAALELGLNNFIETLESVGLDQRLILVSDSSAICPPTPLTSGDCPTTDNPPNYYHVEYAVGGGQIFEAIQDNALTIEALLQAGSQVQIIGITDDESSITAETFDTNIDTLSQRLSQAPFHAIVAATEPTFFPATNCSGFANAIGTNLINYALASDGTFHDICDQNVQADLANLANTIANTSHAVANQIPMVFGEIVITEIMANPQTLLDTNGEWFEIYNSTSMDLELAGCVFSGSDSNNFSISSTLNLVAGGYAVLANSLSPGFSADYVYSNAEFSLKDTEDNFALTCSEIIIDAVTYTSASSGQSLSLSASSLDAAANDNLANWCNNISDSYNGDYGTPGSENDYCL